MNGKEFVPGVGQQDVVGSEHLFTALDRDQIALSELFLGSSAAFTTEALLFCPTPHGRLKLCWRLHTW